MKYILIVLGLLLAYGAYSYVRVALTIKKDLNPPIEQSDKTLGSGPALKYIAAGDSTAVGEGASVVEKSYTYRVAEHFAKDNTVEYRNVGVVGATTDDVLTKQLDQIIDFQPDVVTISIGANDRTHLKSNGAIYDNYKKIIDTVLEKTTAKLYMTDVPNFTNAQLLPSPFIWLLEAQTKSLNPRLMALENERVKIINIHDFGWDTYPDIKVTFAADNFHPNDEGYNNWTNAFLDKMR